MSHGGKFEVFALPFRFNPLQPGTFKTTVQGSDEHKAQEIASFLLTHKGERPLYQEYGIEDPAFLPFDESKVAADFATFYEEGSIQLDKIDLRQRSHNELGITVRFE